MTSKLNTSILFSSDLLLYDLLKKEQKDNPILKKHIISFPSQTKLKNQNYGIFIGHGKNVLKKSTSNSDMYDSQVRVVISTKNQQYMKAKKGIDNATKEIIRVIKNSDLNNRQFRWTESQTVYTSQQGIKYRTLDLVFAEQYSWEKIDYDKGDIELLFGDPVIDDSDISPEEARENEIYELIDRIKELKAEGVDLFPYILKDNF